MEKWKNMPTSKSAVTKDGAALTEQFFGQVSDSIQLVFDLTSRIDERVKMLIEAKKEVDEQIEKLLEIQHHALHRLTVLESKDIGNVQNDLHSLSEKIAIILSDDPQKELEETKLKLSELRNQFLILEMRVGHQSHVWTQIFDAIWKIVLMIIAGYILYKLGLQAPPN